MSATRVLGTLFIAIFVFELVALEVLRGASGQTNAGLVTLGMLWIFGVWVELVVFMVWVIAWIGAGTKLDQEAPAESSNVHLLRAS